MAKLPEDVRSALRLFAFYLGNGTLDHDVLVGIDYRAHLFQFGSDLELVFTIFTNVLEIDDSGKVLNFGEAEHRAAQWIRQYCDPAYVVKPPFAQWEVELQGP